jgi:NADH-quinone oxidoreductase subunit M
MYRFAWALFPHAAAHLRPLIVLIGLASILYGAWRARSQENLKRMVANLCVCQMGFVLLGTATATSNGVNGAIFMMTAQGLVAASLLAVAGILEDRIGHCDIALLGGVAGDMPVFTGLSLVAFFAALGLPGLCLFVGQFLIVVGAFSAGETGPWARFGWRSTSVLACGAIVLTAVASLGAFGKIFFGTPRQPRQTLKDLDQRELSLFIPLAVCMVLLGVIPWILFLCLTQQTVAAMLRAFF